MHIRVYKSDDVCIYVGIINVIVRTITAQNVMAISADSFVDSIGVNTHWGDPHPYFPQYAGLKIKLAESGIRYIRDGANAVTYDRANDLYNSLGIKTIMLTGRHTTGPPPQPLDPSQIDDQLNEIKTQAFAATIALEAPNEYDLEHPPNTDWVGTIKNYSILLYSKAKDDELLKTLPVIGPSLTSAEAYEAVGNSDSFIDYANVHIYQWSYHPGFSGWDNNGSHSITWYLDELVPQQTPSGKRVQSTEAGHHNYIPYGGVSEEADGKYTARTIAEFFRRGIDRTYKYELADGGQAGQEGVFGLLHYNLTEKPSFRAVKNLITVLSDKGPSFEPSTLNYTLSGSMDNVRQILFQKRSGDFYLMVWLEISSWNVTAKIDLYPPPQQVVLTLQDNSGVSSAILYAFNNNADVDTFNLTIDTNQIIFNVTDKINIIKLTTSISYGIYRLLPQIPFRSCPYVDQQWIIKPVSDNFYRLINHTSDEILVATGCHTNDWLRSSCKEWKFDLSPNGYYRITSRHNQGQQLCSLTNSTQVQHWILDWIAAVV